MTLLWSPKNYFMNFSQGLGLLVARTATSLWVTHHLGTGSFNLAVFYF